MTWLLVALGGAAGALARYGVALAVGPRDLPWATLLVNVTGSFALGLALTWTSRGMLGPVASRAVAVGFLGAYTTYSTFAWEVFVLGRGDRMLAAVTYTALSVVLGVLAAALGFRLGEAIQP